MTRSRTWLLSASDSWKRGDALEAGEILYERLPMNERPAWAARVLDICCAGLAKVPAEVLAVREIARTPARWGEAYEAFHAVRELVLANERSAPARKVPEHGILYLAENVAKVTYNASGSRAPFDHNAGWWVVKNARWIVDHSADAEMEGLVWATLSGQPALAKLKRLDRQELRLLWIDDYYDAALSGALLLHDKLRWFEFVSDADHRRRYVVYDLTDAEVEEERRWHALFVEHVGDHWTLKDDGSRGTVKPVSEHAKFYDVYARRSPVDYSGNTIIGWFEL